MDRLDYFNDRINTLEKEKFDLEQQIIRFDKERADYEQRIKDLSNKIGNLEIDVQEAEDLNYNLKRICRERANADRGLKPKKQHDGFVVLSTASYFERYQFDRETKEFLAYRSVIQTPYSVSYSMKMVLKLLKDDNYKCFRCLGNGWYVMMGYNHNAISQKSDYENGNYVFRWNIRVSLQKKYWEIEVCHTKPYPDPIFVSED